MAGKLIWDGKEPQPVYGVDVASIPVVVRDDMVPAPWGGLASRGLIGAFFAYDINNGLDDPESRSLSAVEGQSAD